jgi:hypothetical protein
VTVKHELFPRGEVCRALVCKRKGQYTLQTWSIEVEVASAITNGTQAVASPLPSVVLFPSVHSRGTPVKESGYGRQASWACRPCDSEQFLAPLTLCLN